MQILGTNAKYRLSCVLYAVQDGPVYSLASAGPLLASGGCDDIKLWRWEELVSASKDPQPVCVLTPTLSG